jgi:hypothetical protein
LEFGCTGEGMQWLLHTMTQIDALLQCPQARVKENHRNEVFCKVGQQSAQMAAICFPLDVKSLSGYSGSKSGTCMCQQHCVLDEPSDVCKAD